MPVVMGPPCAGTTKREARSYAMNCCGFDFQTAKMISHARPRSRGAMRPRFARNFLTLSIRGRREYRVHAAPAVSCATVHERNAHEHTGSAEAIRHSLRNGFTAYFVLSPVTGLSCHRRLRKLPFANLTPASGRQDHTTSPSASGALVSSTISVHRIPFQRP
jgi:hypothetical protein